MASLPTILVTGATGFIGRHLVRQLSRDGTALRLLVRSQAKAEALFGSQFELVEGEVTNPDAVERACRGMRQVYHLAGYYEFGRRHQPELWRTNVDGTRHILAACRRAAVERLIHGSTAGVLHSVGRPRTHRDFPTRPPTGCHYKVSKWEAEQSVLRAAAQGLPAVIASPTAPLGTGDDRPTPTGRVLLDLLQGRFPVCPHTGFNVAAVEDVAAGLQAVGERGRNGQRYVLGDSNVWLRDLLRQGAQLAGVRPPRGLVPWPLVALGGLAAEGWAWLGGSGSSRLCWETAYYARQRQFFDCTHSHSELGWKPQKTLAETLRDALSWFATFPHTRPVRPPVQTEPVTSR
ncbi:MAG: NAD-dependent epimerase/dehydratase family protein [Verrucomicrobia bacterium]|nr:NAD-dependent epimerase/dehydratase family protein [Verrucomicrobiota bacterium]